MTTKPPFQSRNTPSGFIFGPATVNRLYSDKTGVGIEVETKRERLIIRVTRGGRIVAGKAVRKNRIQLITESKNI